MALSLQEEQRSQDLSWEQLPEDVGDLELARKLQEEEDQRASQYYQEQEPAAAATAAEGQVKAYCRWRRVMARGRLSMRKMPGLVPGTSPSGSGHSRAENGAWDSLGCSLGAT